MALEIIDEKIVGKIDNLQDKLEGKLPIDRLELLVLINSWGRINFFYTEYLYEDVKIEKCEATQSEQAKLVRKECYDLSNLDVSKITNMENLFKHSLFDGDISNWNVSNVSTMNQMFFSAESFNQSIGNWDVSKVTNMLDMFSFAIKFNSPLNNWDTSNVTTMNGMFYDAEKFNSDISDWDVSNVEDISFMFAYTKEFNQDISSWNTKNVINMQSMFLDAKAFNQNISKWNLDNIINCDCMFNKAEAFIDKYNSGEPLPYKTEDIKTWINNNRDKMNDIDIEEKHGEEIDNFFSIINNNEIKKDK